jgi:molecular chaperone DnaK
LAWEYEKDKGVTVSALPPEQRREIGYRLLNRAEEVKMHLVSEEEVWRFSNASQKELALLSVTVIVPELKCRTQVNMELYERVVAHLLDPSLKYHKNILQPVEDALRQAGIGPADIDQVFLVGGMSRLPCVKKTLGRYFPGKDLYPQNFDHAVARGAAIHHRHLCQGMKDITV